MKVRVQRRTDGSVVIMEDNLNMPNLMDMSHSKFKKLFGFQIKTKNVPEPYELKLVKAAR